MGNFLLDFDLYRELIESVLKNGVADIEFIVYVLLFIVYSPRYVLSKVLLFLYDLIREMHGLKRKNTPGQTLLSQNNMSDLPFVTVICPGRNEEKTIYKTIASLLKQDYPRIEIVAIDDGSTDNTWQILQKFKYNRKVRLYRRNANGGKNAAANLGLNLSRESDIVIAIDADTEFSPNGISEIVKPFRDPRVGAVSANLRVVNWNKNLLTRYQAADYLNSISLGRRISSVMGTLAICSGAFGAFRYKAVKRVGGWDVGPGEDGDMTVKIRKLGYKVKFAPNAVCYTKVPETWKAFWKQRRRWNRGAIRYKMRKHFDMINPFYRSYSFFNMLVIFDIFFFRIFLCYNFFVLLFICILFYFDLLASLFGMILLSSFVYHLIVLIIQLFYSSKPKEDFAIMLASFINYPYILVEKTARIISMTEEFLFRKSYKDPFYPRKVGDVTIHW